MLAHTLEIIVRSTEIDVNGHVNNAKYMEYLEWAREDWYERIGLDYSTLKSMNMITVVVHISANYRREAFQNDRLTVASHLTKVGTTSFNIHQVIKNYQDETVLDADVVIVTVDPSTKAPTRVPDKIRSLL